MVHNYLFFSSLLFCILYLGNGKKIKEKHMAKDSTTDAFSNDGLALRMIAPDKWNLALSTHNGD